MSSVVKAMRKYEAEASGPNKLKLGYGKSFSTCVIWINDVDGIFPDEKALLNQVKRFGTVKNVVYGEKKAVLIFYESIDEARKAVDDLRLKLFSGSKTSVDFASRDYQTYFMAKLAKPEDGRGRSNSSGSWMSGNSIDYEDRPYESSNSRARNSVSS